MNIDRPKIGTYRFSDPFDVCHLKYDGHCTFVEVTHDGPLIYTRRPTDITDKLRWHPVYYLSAACPVGTQLMGELWVDGQPSSDVKTHINAQSSELRFSVFAVPSMPADTPVAAAMATAGKHGFDTAPYFDEAPHGFDRMPPNIEGYVFKTGNLTGWKRWKPTLTIDLIVKSAKKSTNGAFFGLLGGLECVTTEGHPVASVSSGIELMQRHAFTDNPPIGQVVEVSYQYVGSKGRLRHPRFRCIREDKKTSECSVNQDPDLFSYWSHDASVDSLT